MGSDLYPMISQPTPSRDRINQPTNKGASKCHNTDEKAPILWCTFLHQYLDFFNYPTTPSPISKMYWCALFILISNIHGKMCTTVLSKIGLVPTQNIYLSLCIAPIFWLRIGTNLSKTGG